MAAKAHSTSTQKKRRADQLESGWRDEQVMADLVNDIKLLCRITQVSLRQGTTVGSDAAVASTAGFGGDAATATNGDVTSARRLDKAYLQSIHSLQTKTAQLRDLLDNYKRICRSQTSQDIVCQKSSKRLKTQVSVVKVLDWLTRLPSSEVDSVPTLQDTVARDVDMRDIRGSVRSDVGSPGDQSSLEAECDTAVGRTPSAQGSDSHVAAALSALDKAGALLSEAKASGGGTRAPLLERKPSVKRRAKRAAPTSSCQSLQPPKPSPRPPGGSVC